MGNLRSTEILAAFMASVMFKSTTRSLGDHCHSLQGFIFAMLLEHTLEDFVHAEGGDEQFRYILNGRCKEIRIRSISKIF